MYKCKYICYIFAIITCLQVDCKGFDKEFTVIIEPGKKECFFQAVKLGETIEIEYQVVDGQHGDLDINFELIDPHNKIIITDYKESDKSHRHDPKIEGDYKFCFDNTISRFNRKEIFFSIIIGTDEDAWDSDFAGLDLSPAELYEIKVEDIRDYITKIRGHINKARHIQDLLGTLEARDRNIAEENFFKVNTWSICQILVMLCTGVMQIVMVRSIFEIDSKINKIWKKLGL